MFVFFFVFFFKLMLHFKLPRGILLFQLIKYFWNGHFSQLVFKTKIKTTVQTFLSVKSFLDVLCIVLFEGGEDDLEANCFLPRNEHTFSIDYSRKLSYLVLIQRVRLIKQRSLNEYIKFFHLLHFFFLFLSHFISFIFFFYTEKTTSFNIFYFFVLAIVIFLIIFCVFLYLLSFL